MNDLVKTTEQTLSQYEPASLVGQMSRHHPIHGIFAHVFEATGGAEQLVQWAKENYTDFVRVFARMAPPASGDVTVRQMNIQVNPQLKRTPLDGEVVSGN